MLSEAKHLLFLAFETLRYAQGDRGSNFLDVSNCEFLMMYR
jgi:hypothetical protein